MEYIVVYASNPEVCWDELLSRIDAWKIPIGPIVPKGVQALEITLTDYDKELLIAKADLFLYDTRECLRGDTRVPGIYVDSKLSLDFLEKQIERITNYHNRDLRYVGDVY